MGLTEFNRAVRELDKQRGEWIKDLDQADKDISSFAGEIDSTIFSLISPRPGLSQAGAVQEATRHLNEIANRMRQKAQYFRQKQQFSY